MSAKDLIEGSLNLLNTLFTAYHDDQGSSTLLLLLQSRVSRIQRNLDGFGESLSSQGLFTSVSARIASDFEVLVERLQDVCAEIDRPLARRLLTAGPTGEKMRAIDAKLDDLERHVEVYGLMKNMHGTFEAQLVAIREDFRKAAVAAPARDPELCGQVHKIEESIAMLMAEICNGQLAAAPASSNVQAPTGLKKTPLVPDERLDRHELDRKDVMQTMRARPKQLSWQVSRSALSPADKKGIQKKFDDICISWNLDLNDIEFEMGKGGWPVSLGEGSFSAVYKARQQLRGAGGEPEGNPVSVSREEAQSVS